MQPYEAPATIVVVDDYQDGRDLMTTILRSEGFEVKEAGSGREALALAAEQPALMVLDVNLPDLDGFEVCRRLKSDPHTAGVAVLQVSAAYRDSGDRVRGLQGGADAYLTLPIDRDEIVATVRALLRMRRIERESAALRAVTRLANAAAHEINNPLSVITGQLHFLAKDPAVPATRVTQMQEAADRIRDIVLQMLQVTRVEVLKHHEDLPEMMDLHRSASVYKSVRPETP
jgi:two-component system, sensor histidine kinase